MIFVTLHNIAVYKVMKQTVQQTKVGKPNMTKGSAGRQASVKKEQSMK